MEPLVFDFEKDSIFLPYSRDILERENLFECGDKDLDEFFHQDAFLYENELLGKSYCWINKKNEKDIIAIITLSYEGIKLDNIDSPSKNRFQRKIPNTKRHKSYPAVLIGRLGVNKIYQGKGYNIGSHILNLMKLLFNDGYNKAACRFIIVDAYNNQVTLRFYEKNGFKYLYKTEESEKKAFNINLNEKLRSRIMYFDLKLALLSLN